jgi:ABC-type transport system involved in multi-copper enzyme maturation permease subunit
MSSFTHAAYEVARKEVLQHIRTKRLLIIGSLLVVALVLITIVFGPSITRGFNVAELGISGENLLFIAFLTFGGYLFIQLLAIVLTADAVCSEWSSRTIFLLLSKPVSRSAFVLGKFAGSLATIVATLVILLPLDYAIMQGLYKGTPSGGEVLGFLGAVGVLVLGCAALAALALFFSTLTRSTTMALLMTLGAWIIGFKVIGSIGIFITLGQKDPDPHLAQNFQYLDPGHDMTAAADLLVPDDLGPGSIFGSGPESLGLALFALAAHTVLWFALSFWIVQKRNFE